ncbi:TetR/AcrR family transcriptional regulator [Embleya sp. NPDC059259]|uniref:TetR/AcrR family transcriptional regulator n=1 Tax=unclassified Embleya TaxID=2699296 RepID=UPI0036CDF715
MDGHADRLRPAPLPRRRTTHALRIPVRGGTRRAPRRPPGYAATAAVGRHGPARLRVADIAEVAGVARGSVSYYFSDPGDLLRQVYRQAADRFYTSRTDTAAGLPDARDKLVACARRGLPAGPQDELAVVLYEFSAAARDESEYATPAQSLHDRQVAMYGSILEIGQAQGHFRFTEPIRDVAANLVTLEDGYGLHIVSRNSSLPPARALALILAHARQATGCPELRPDRVIPDPDAPDRGSGGPGTAGDGGGRDAGGHDVATPDNPRKGTA